MKEGMNWIPSFVSCSYWHPCRGRSRPCVGLCVGDMYNAMGPRHSVDERKSDTKRKPEAEEDGETMKFEYTIWKTQKGEFW